MFNKLHIVSLIEIQPDRLLATNVELYWRLRGVNPGQSSNLLQVLEANLRRTQGEHPLRRTGPPSVRVIADSTRRQTPVYYRPRRPKYIPQGFQSECQRILIFQSLRLIITSQTWLGDVLERRMRNLSPISETTGFSILTESWRYVVHIVHSAGPQFKCSNFT